MSWPEYGSLSHQSPDDMARGRGRRPARQEGRPRLRAVEGPQGGRAAQRLLGHPLRCRSPGLAPRVLGHGPALPGRHLRHPRRRHRPALPPPRERAGPVARGRARLRPVLAPQRLGHGQGPEDGQVPRQRPRGQPRRRGRHAARRPLLPDRRALPLDHRVPRGLAHRGAGHGRADRGLPRARRPDARTRGRERRSAASLPRRDGRRPQRVRGACRRSRHGACGQHRPRRR